MRVLTTTFFLTLLTALAGCGSVVIQAEPGGDGGSADVPAVTDAPPAPDRPPAVDVPARVDVPVACASSADCARGLECVGPEGCGTPWTCQPVDGCTPDLTSYCGCDGTTFQSSSSCPGRPYLQRGACGILPPPPPDAGPATCTIMGRTCRVGVPCRLDECTTCTCWGDAVTCGIEPGCAMDGGVDGGVAPPPLCPPDDARGVGNCAAFFGHAWDGARCVAVGGCSCAGTACRSLARDPMACEFEHRACPRPL